jgi:hypothetical protein
MQDKPSLQDWDKGCLKSGSSVQVPAQGGCRTCSKLKLQNVQHIRCSNVFSSGAAHMLSVDWSLRSPGGPDAAAAAFCDVEVDVPPGGPMAPALGPDAAAGAGDGDGDGDGETGTDFGFTAGAGAVTGGGGGGGGGGEGIAAGQLKLLGTFTWRICPERTASKGGVLVEANHGLHHLMHWQHGQLPIRALDALRRTLNRCFHSELQGVRDIERRRAHPWCSPSPPCSPARTAQS